MNPASLEEERCRAFLERSEDEVAIGNWMTRRSPFRGTLIVTQGFEERSLGLLRRLAELGARLASVVVCRYEELREYNDRYAAEFEELSNSIAEGRVQIVSGTTPALWMGEALRAAQGDELLIDISALPNYGVFAVLDEAARERRRVLVGYSEAREYWPKRSDWQRLKKELADLSSLPDIVDNKPWMFGPEHKVVLVEGHEGYDSAGGTRALIAFLPYKCARLAAILGVEDYAQVLFIAGLPRLKRNSWRSDCLRTINEPVISKWPVVDIRTFYYRRAFHDLMSVLFSDTALLADHDVHLAILGAKLQTVACWAMSSIIKSITVITSIPERYFPKAWSEGVGGSWVFELPRP